jgi:hypothetical protein
MRIATGTNNARPRRWRAWIAAGLAGWLLLAAAPAEAQDWAKKMFDHTVHDFGVVARGAKVEHRFVVENIYEEDMHIKSVSSTCRCSVPRVTKQLLKSWEKAEIVVALDTRAEPGRKDGTIKVEFDPPFPAEVQLHVYSYIRGDIVVQPGEVQFGAVEQGLGAQRSVSVSYAGRDDWRIERVECANPCIEASPVETGRTPRQGDAAGKVGYNLTVRLKKDAPPGYIRDQLVLVTNDYNPRSARVPVTVDGLVAAALTVRPSPLPMGVVKAGESVTRNLVVMGRAKFRILSAKSSDDRFQCEVPAEALDRHILAVKFLAKDADAAAGKLSAKIRLETDLPGAAPLEVEVFLQVVPAKAAS